MIKPRHLFMWLFFITWIVGILMFMLFGEPLWALTWGLILVVVGTMEAVTKLKTGFTLSQRYVKLHEEKPIIAWVLSITTLLGMILLQAHLLWR